MSFLSIFKWEFWSIHLSSGKFLCAKSWVYLCCIVLLTLMFWIAVLVNIVNSKGTNHCTTSSLHLEVCVRILMDWLFSFLDLFFISMSLLQCFDLDIGKGDKQPYSYLKAKISKRIWTNVSHWKKKKKGTNLGCFVELLNNWFVEEVCVVYK